MRHEDKDFPVQSPCLCLQVFSSSSLEDNTDQDLTRQNKIHHDNGCPQMFNGGEIKMEGTERSMLFSSDSARIHVFVSSCNGGIIFIFFR